LALLAFVGCLARAPERVRAESPDDARARAHFAAGQEYYDQERYLDAASEFSEAYQLSGRPEMLINRARAEVRAGMVEHAIASLELLFERHPQTSYRAEAEGELASLRAQLANRKPESESNAADGQQPPAPAPLPLIQPQKEPRRDLKLWPPRLPTLIVGGTMVASVLVSVGTGWAAHAKYKWLDQHCRPDDQCPDGRRSADERAQGRTLARVSTGFTFVSVALAAATAVLWAYDVKAHKTQFSLALNASPSFAGAQVRWVQR
jgi:tetratricopeptide (TPR) repeat protein